MRCSADDLTITLHLLLEHDLRLQAPDRPTFEAWQQGLRLLLRLLVLPQGLPGARCVLGAWGVAACLPACLRVGPFVRGEGRATSGPARKSPTPSECTSPE